MNVYFMSGHIIDDIRKQIVLLSERAKEKKIHIVLTSFLTHFLNLLVVQGFDRFIHEKCFRTVKKFYFFGNIKKLHSGHGFLALKVNKF